MKRTLLTTSLYCVLIALSLFTAKTVHAAEGDITIAIGDTQEVISAATLDLWRGSFTVGDKPLFMGGNKTQTKVAYSPAKVYEWVTALESKTNSEPASPRLVITNNHATEFTPPNIGKRLDALATTIEVLTSLSNNKQVGTAVIHEIKPEVALSSTNNLGINELIGRGTSNFKGSPKNRRHNISVGVEKLKGMIVAPGEEFSFNENICPVDKSTGYLPELVIKSNDTVPEYGGGLCQVSSTVFRAAMDAGLEIVQRKNHSYAVQYYAVPWGHGADATTYCGGVDFKFKNDTAGHVLIWPYFDGNDGLVFDFYGTNDGRAVVLEKPTQYDKKSNGALKATWIRHVTKNGETHTDTFNSNYLPPALFHKEEKLDSPNQTTPIATPPPLNGGTGMLTVPPPPTGATTN
jgi:vancomycin resistance protein YoaR